MTSYLLSIDPGLSTGVALLSYEEGTPAELVEGWQFGGGVAGFLKWWETLQGIPSNHTCAVIFEDETHLIVEKFTARNTRGFAYTTASLEPLRCEGALIALGLMPDYTLAEKRWRDPGLQYLVGGKDKADKKRRQHRFLKDSMFYKTGKDLNAPDADDFRSATAHGISYIARELKHKPTFDMISAYGEENR